MELKYSVKKVPYIELDGENKIIFSTANACDKGYKWLVFSGVATTTMAVSAGKGKSKVTSRKEIREPLSTCIGMGFDKSTTLTKKGNKHLTTASINSLRKLFRPYVDNDGVFLFENIKRLENDVNSDAIDKEDLLEEDPMGYYEDDDDE
jgi:hypothetical protein